MDDTASHDATPSEPLGIANQTRLHELESKIRKAAEQIQKNGLEIGRYLCEIRDEELWRSEFESWNKYLQKRAGDLVGKSFAQAAYLIRAAEVAKRLPSNINDNIALTASHLKEIARLAPKDEESNSGTALDYSKLRKSDVARVLKTAAEIAKERQESGRKTKSSGEVSVRDNQNAVDQD